jgi:hypothetical protein
VIDVGDDAEVADVVFGHGGGTGRISHDARECPEVHAVRLGRPPSRLNPRHGKVFFHGNEQIPVYSLSLK